MRVKTFPPPSPSPLGSRPKEQMIVIFMAQLNPTGDLTLDYEVNALAYQAIND